MTASRNCGGRITVATLEDERLPRVVVRQVIPLRGWVGVDLQVLRDEVVEDHIARYRILLKVKRAPITEAKGPVVKGPSDRFPDANMTLLARVEAAVVS